MNLIGKIVLLRAIEPRDNKMLLQIINDKETEYMIGGLSFPVSERSQEIWTDNLKNETNTLRCVIEVQEKSIGVVMLTNIDYINGNAEVHIKLAPGEFRGKGYGTDTIMTIVKYAFNELRLNCIYSRVLEHNKISQRVFKKCGFKEEGILRNRVYKKGKYIDVISFSLINEEIRLDT